MNRQERRRQAKLNPAHHQARLAQGAGLYRAGRLDEAEALFRQILHETADEPEAACLLGELLTDRGRADEAITLLQRLTKRHAAHAGGHYALGNACRLSGQIEAAIAAYGEALRRHPGFAGAHHGLGLALRLAQREAEAAEQLRAAVAALPDWAVAWMDLGITLAMLGDLPAAEEALSRAVALAPTLGEAQRHLAALRPAANETALETLAVRVADARTPPAERPGLLFAMARQAEAMGRYEAAFGHARAANQLLRTAQAQAGIGFERARFAADIERIIAAFPADGFAARAAQGDPSPAPVFILGMPRAGSTLFEQIAASHSRVHGAGEQPGIGAVAARLGWAPNPAWSKAALAGAARDYLAPLLAQAPGAERIIDKMPDNIFQLGLIAALFPHARVIFCERDARDVAISCFFQNFARPLGFDTDLEDCAARIAGTARLADHWRAVLPLAHMTLRYEDLLADPESQSRRLIEFLGLDWEPACLDFHRTQRPVRTASWHQVRQPLYRDALGRWRHYASFLPAALQP